MVIESAINDEAHLLVPPRQIGRAIGQLFGTTYETVRQRASKTFFTLWERSLADVRESIDPSCLAKLKQGISTSSQTTHWSQAS